MSDSEEIKSGGMAGGKILVVDDEEGIREMLKKAFTTAGYQVQLAESAEKALELLRHESIMVMFLDLKLPGMSGVDLCQRIRKENCIGIINAITGYTDLFGLLECRKAGFDDLFVKPFSIKIILEAAAVAFKKIERWGVSQYDLI
jgi:DNA-binding response OmpR family regulator